MTKTVLILFSLLSMGSIYSTYTGLGLQEVTSEKKKVVRSSRGFSTGSSFSSGGWSSGK
jgi:uncharacterized membrane protein YgcG